ncbi:replication initiation protein [Roseomonas sp. F4]
MAQDRNADTFGGLGDWADIYDGTYQHHSRLNRQRRADRRAQDRIRRARKAAAGQGPTPSQRALADLARDRRLSRNALVELRWTVGYTWRGGPVAGNSLYRRQPLTYRGLVSDEAPILRLFAASTRRAYALLTGAIKAEASGTDSKVLALDCEYVETNKVMRRVLRVELDRAFSSWEVIERALQTRGVPLPNIVVGFELADGRVVNPHLIWLIDAAVPHTAKGMMPHKALFASVLRSLTAELLDVGADPGGLANSARHKNPLSPLWDRRIMAAEPYSLAALKAALPLGKASAKLKTAVTERAGACPAPLLQDHPDPVVAAGSNALFRALVRLAQKRVEWHREHGSEIELVQELATEALRLVPYGRRAEKVAIARAEGVGAWTWTHYRPKSEVSKQVLTPEQVRAARQGGQERAAMSRRANTMAAAVVAFLRIAATGARPTQAAVAAAVGRSDRALRPLWSEILAAAAPEVCSLDDKKGAAGSVAANGLIPPAPLPLPPASMPLRELTAFTPASARVKGSAEADTVDRRSSPLLPVPGGTPFAPECSTISIPETLTKVGESFGSPPECDVHG